MRPVLIVGVGEGAGAGADAGWAGGRDGSETPGIPAVKELELAKVWGCSRGGR